MSAEKQAMELAIRRALEMNGNYQPNGVGAMRQQLANDIANAVDAYVVFKLGALKAVLTNPTVYTGTGPTGPVTIVPGSIAGYNP